MRALALALLVVGPLGLAFAQSFNSDAEARFNIGIGHLREGRYDQIIRYRQHVLPVRGAIEAAVQGASPAQARA